MLNLLRQLSNLSIINNIRLKKFKTTISQLGGRSVSGRLVTKHRSGRYLRPFYLFYNKSHIESLYTEFFVISLIYDANRSSRLALVINNRGTCQYILAPENITIGSRIYYSNNVFFSEMTKHPGSCSSLRLIPTGTSIYNIERFPRCGGVFARAAGCSAKLMLKKKLYNREFACIKLPSKKLIYVPTACCAFIGSVSNSAHRYKVIHKAGVNVRLGFRPVVRGVAMNPVDHPHGGGEGKSAMSCLPKTASGLPAKWKKTVSKHKKQKRFVFLKRINKFGVSFRV